MINCTTFWAKSFGPKVISMSSLLERRSFSEQSLKRRVNKLDVSSLRSRGRGGHRQGHRQGLRMMQQQVEQNSVPVAFPFSQVSRTQRNMQARESPIQCIFFCEFHHIAGPKITYQVPEDFVTKEDFDSLNAYLIPKKELQGRLITVNSRGKKVIGYPTGIDSSKYDRNRLTFNLCLVCVASMRTVQYEPLVKKLAHYLLNLELECNFLSKEETKHNLPKLMADIREQLNSPKRCCALPVTPSTTIHLKVVRVQPEPQQVQENEVPIFLTSEASIIPSQWDLTTQQVLPYIDGYRHVAKIAAEADVEVSLVKACIQNMIYYGIITLIPIFQYSNVYVTTPQLVNLAEKVSVQEECVRFVARQETNLPLFRSVFQLYCYMKPGVTVRDLCARYNPSLQGVDEKKLVRFGLLKGILRRLQKFPVFVSSDPSIVSAQRGLFRFFDGNHSYDEICCKAAKSYSELDEKTERHPSVVICWK